MAEAPEDTREEVDDDEPRELTYEQQQDLRRIVRILTVGYQAWLAAQPEPKK